MWKHRLHVCFHRVIGGSIAMVGLLNELKQIDLTTLPFVGTHAGLVTTLIGLTVISLEFLPILGQLLDGDDRHEEDCQK